ncbi:MAG TPA: hypothetical protein VFJ48_01880, partial [Casimicrobiaceae bacterium]|nr:hypothetical protein [Casimicrobiaceae bacterium]
SERLIGAFGPREGPEMAPTERSYGSLLAKAAEPPTLHLFYGISDCLLAKGEFCYTSRLKSLFANRNQLTAQDLFIYSAHEW